MFPTSSRALQHYIDQPNQLNLWPSHSNPNFNPAGQHQNSQDIGMRSLNQSPHNLQQDRHETRGSFLSNIHTAELKPHTRSKFRDKVGHGLINGLSIAGIGGVGAALYLGMSKASVIIPGTVYTAGTASLAAVAGAAVAGGMALYNAIRSCVPSRSVNSLFNPQFKGADKFISHFESGQIYLNESTRQFEFNTDLLKPQDIQNLKDEYLYNKHGQTVFGSHLGETRFEDLLNEINSKIHGANFDDAHEIAAKTLNKDINYSQNRKMVSTVLLSAAAGGAAGALAGGLGAPIGAGVGLAFGLVMASGGQKAKKKMTQHNLDRFKNIAATHEELFAQQDLIKILHNLNSYSYMQKSQSDKHNKFRQEMRTNTDTKNTWNNAAENRTPELKTILERQLNRYTANTGKSSFNANLDFHPGYSIDLDLDLDLDF